MISMKKLKFIKIFHNILKNNANVRRNKPNNPNESEITDYFI